MTGYEERKQARVCWMEGYAQVGKLTQRLGMESVFALEILSWIGMFVGFVDPETVLSSAKGQEGDLCTPALTSLHSLNSFQNRVLSVNFSAKKG